MNVSIHLNLSESFMSCTMSRLHLSIKSLPEVLEDINVPAGTGDGVK